MADTGGSNSRGQGLLLRVHQRAARHRLGEGPQAAGGPGERPRLGIVRVGQEVLQVLYESGSTAGTWGDAIARQPRGPFKNDVRKY